LRLQQNGLWTDQARSGSGAVLKKSAAGKFMGHNTLLGRAAITHRDIAFNGHAARVHSLP
jgi:hypothetical protein